MKYIEILCAEKSKKNEKRKKNTNTTMKLWIRASNNTLNSIELLAHREPNPSISLYDSFPVYCLCCCCCCFGATFVVVVASYFVCFCFGRLCMCFARCVSCSSAFIKPNFMVLYNFFFREFVPGTNVPIHTCAHYQTRKERKMKQGNSRKNRIEYKPTVRENFFDSIIPDISIKICT